MKDISNSVDKMAEIDISNLSIENKQIFDLKLLGLKTVYEFLGALCTEQTLREANAKLKGNIPLNISEVTITNHIIRINMKQYKTLLDRPFYTGHIKNFDKMTVELSPYMTEYEIDQCISFMQTLQDTKHDINPSAEDCKTQLQIMFGRERFLKYVKHGTQRIRNG